MVAGDKGDDAKRKFLPHELKHCEQWNLYYIYTVGIFFFIIAEINLSGENTGFTVKLRIKKTFYWN